MFIELYSTFTILYAIKLANFQKIFPSDFIN